MQKQAADLRIFLPRITIKQRIARTACPHRKGRFTMDLRWNEYYETTEPAKRRDLLAKLSETADDGLCGLRKTLFSLRYKEMNRAPYLADLFLGAILDLMQLARVNVSSARGKKKVLDLLDRLGRNTAASFGPEGEDVLFAEYKNAVALYYKSHEESGYRYLFGLMKAPDSVRRNVILENAVDMSRSVSERSGLKDEMALWNKAVREVLSSMDEGLAEDYDTFKIKM